MAQSPLGPSVQVRSLDDIWIQTVSQRAQKQQDLETEAAIIHCIVS